MNREKKFFLGSIIGGIGVLAVFLLVNMYIDLFGLFSSGSEKNKKVVYDERSDKYIMAHNYIPKNFNGILLGPSLSANLNTKDILTYEMYNLSFMGANFSEQKYLFEKVMSQENDVKVVVLSIHPYFTETYGFKSEDMSDQVYYSAFGSYGLLKEYLIGVVRNFSVFPYKYPKHQYNGYGYNDYDNQFAVEDVGAKISKEVELHKDEPILFNDETKKELHQFDSTWRANDIRIVYYFHPIPHDIYSAREDRFENYKATFLQYVDSEYVVDFNTDKFLDFRKDYSNYIDHGHLSKKGQKFILDYMDNYLEKL